MAKSRHFVIWQVGTTFAIGVCMTDEQYQDMMDCTLGESERAEWAADYAQMAAAAAHSAAYKASGCKPNFAACKGNAGSGCSDPQDPYPAEWL